MRTYLSHLNRYKLFKCAEYRVNKVAQESETLVSTGERSAIKVLLNNFRPTEYGKTD